MKLKSRKFYEIRVKIERVVTIHGLLLVKPRPDAIYGSFTFQIGNPTVSL
jgi:hypothetical protein